MAHRWVDVHGLHLHCVEAGTGPLVVLLHGFPEFWYAWRHQIPALADAGYRVVAPDLPGYNTSDKPPPVRDYRPRVLVQDVADLIVALGAGSAAVAGHDWGGGLAWLLAMQHPERVERLVLLNAPHPMRFLKGLRSPGQLRRSWYMLAFQLPWLPERLVAARALGAAPGPAPPADPAGRLDPPGHRPLRGRGRPARRPTRRDQLPPGRLPGQPAGPGTQPASRGCPDPDRLGRPGLLPGPGAGRAGPRLVPDVRVERIAEVSHWVQADAGGPGNIHDGSSANGLRQ